METISPSVFNLLNAFNQAGCILEQMPPGSNGLHDYRYLAINTAFKKLFGEDDLTNRTIRDIFPGEPEAWYAQFTQVLETGASIRFEHELPSRQLMLETCIARFEDDHAMRLLVTMRDITEQINLAKAQETLRTHEALLTSQQLASLKQTAQKFEIVLNGIQDHIFSFDRDGRVLYANRNLINLWGIQPGEEVGKDLAALGYPPGLIKILHHYIKHVFEKGETVHDESSYTSPTGVVGYYEYFISPVFKADGKVDHVIGSARDITARIQAEAARQGQEIFKVTLSVQEEERKRIAESLHNGLGQLLYGIKISLSGLSLEMPFAAFNESKNYISNLLSEAIAENRRISHELMPVTLEEFGLKTAIEDICEQLQEGLKMTCKVKGYRGRMEKYLELAIYRMVQELMTNVVKHAQATEATTTLTIGPRQVIIVVADNGQGMAPPATKRNGIGLSSIRSRVNLLNGQMNVRSDNTGTSVEIMIPVPKQ